jgi:hypothetical protein
MICPSGGQPPEVGHPQGVFGVFSYYRLVMLFLIMVCLTVALAFDVMRIVYFVSSHAKHHVGQRSCWCLRIFHYIDVHSFCSQHVYGLKVEFRCCFVHEGCGRRIPFKRTALAMDPLEVSPMIRQTPNG